MKRLVATVVTILVFLGNSSVSAQVYEGDSAKHEFRMRVGTSLTYIWDNPNNRFREYTWALQASANPFAQFHVGVRMLHVWRQSIYSPLEHFSLYGAYAQYHIGKVDRITLFPEVGYFRGDYCTCGTLDPFRRVGLNYLLVGGGFQIHLWKGLGLQTAFFVYQILNRIPLDYSYTQYVIGLTYDLKFKRNKGKRIGLVSL